MSRTVRVVLLAFGGWLAAVAPALAQPGALSWVSPSASAQLLAAAVGPDGSVYAAGQSTAGNVFVERLSSSGTVTGSYTGAPGVARAVAVEANGDVVLAGAAGAAMFVERLTPALAPDGGFGSGGVATAFSGQSGVANSVALGPNGEIAAAGSVGSIANNATSAAVALFSATGAVSAQQTPNLGPNVQVSGVAVQAGGDIVVAGRQNPGQLVNGVLARLTPSLALDPSFAGGAGYAVYHYSGSGATTFTSVAVDPSGNLVVGGVAVGGPSTGLPSAIFVHYSADGTLDTTFGSGGVEAILSQAQGSPPDGEFVGAAGVAIAGGGLIVGAGQYNTSAVSTEPALWGLTPSGQSDAQFGSGGSTLGVGQSTTYEACGIAVAPAGSPDAGTIITVGDTPPEPNYTPCQTGESSTGYVASYAGNGAPPAPGGGSPVTSAAPVVTPGAVTSTSTTATVTGQVNPEGLATAYQVQYGTSTAYGSLSPASSAGSGASSVPVSVTLTGLAPGMTYHYRLVASNAAGISYTADGTFTTGSSGSGGGSGGSVPASRPPVVLTGSVVRRGEVSVTLAGTVDPEGGTTTYTFQYGTAPRLGASSRPQTVTGSGPRTVRAVLSGLRPGTLYHWRLVATNSAGTAAGSAATFRTQPRLRLQVLRIGPKRQPRSVARAGVVTVVRCSQGCRLTVALELSAAEARSLGLGHRPVRVAGRTVRLGRPGSHGVTVLFAARYAKLLARRRVQLTVTVLATPLAGGPRAVASRTLTSG
jgi:uncharacterized delta-60 repeat protein